MTQSSEAALSRPCPWCSATAAAEATSCPACGAALVQPEAIADLRIPGVTTVDPGLEWYASQPMHVRPASPSQAMAGGVIMAAAAGGPVGLAALGGLAAVATAEYLSSRGSGISGPVDLDAVGQPSGYVLRALEQSQGAGDRPSSEVDNTWADIDS